MVVLGTIITIIPIIIIEDKIKAQKNKSLTQTPEWPLSTKEVGNRSVVLINGGATKMTVIKVIREVSYEIGLKGAKAIADNGGEVKSNLSENGAAVLKNALEETGATAEIR